MLVSGGGSDSPEAWPELAGPAEQFAGLLTWAAEESGFLDHGEREEVIGTEGRELQRGLLQATFDRDAAREERIGYGQAREIIEARTGVTAGRAQLAGDLAAWTGDFYEERARDAEGEQPDSDVIMMQGDGKGIALRPEHRKGGGTDPAHPGIKKMAEIVAVADFTPAVREPEDIAAPPAGRRTPAPSRGTSGYRPPSPMTFPP